MASINDYNWHDRRPNRRAIRPLRIILAQAMAALILLIAIITMLGQENDGENWLGYVVSQSLATENSWTNFGYQLNPEQAQPPNNQPASVPAAAAPGNIEFVAPASGVVIRDIAAALNGQNTQQAIIIQGLANQQIKAVAAGQISSISQGENGYTIEVSHNEGFSSLYQGISQTDLASGQALNSGDNLGISESGEILFALYLNQDEVDPLYYLFSEDASSL